MRLLYENEQCGLARDRAATKYNVPAREEIDAAVFARTFLGRVVAQSADLATVDVELEPDTPIAQRVLPQLIRVPIFAGIPGQVVELRLDRSNTEYLCCVCFLNADRTKPVIAGWQASSKYNEVRRSRVTRLRGAAIQLGEQPTRKVARDADPVNATMNMAGWLHSVSAFVGIQPPDGAIGVIADGSEFVWAD